MIEIIRYLQFVFAVKHGQCLIAEEYKEELHKYITRLVQKRKAKMLAVHWMQDHIQLFVGIRVYRWLLTEPGYCCLFAAINRELLRSRKITLVRKHEIRIQPQEHPVYRNYRIGIWLGRSIL
jgi:hypothetical protein